ncbi:hypothetical protein AADZ90_005290 [Aestuariibius sp. 2305UL40-4]|uniref:hypothetical protein n=1 Tax=Aestuariibius violaceus TaxID=3234132 RepID=UPI0034953A26
MPLVEENGRFEWVSQRKSMPPTGITCVIGASDFTLPFTLARFGRVVDARQALENAIGDLNARSRQFGNPRWELESDVIEDLRDRLSKIEDVA